MGTEDPRRGSRGGRGSSLGGRGGRPFRTGSWRNNDSLDTNTPSLPYGELIMEIKREDVVPSMGDPSIKDCEYIASYSWVGQGAPTIIVPGKPPIWNAPTTHRKLKPDRGNFLADPNAARYPRFPIEPAARAVLCQVPEVDTGLVDIFTCASVLGKLFRFIQGDDDKEFRFIVEKVGDTVFFVRKEDSPTQLIPNIRGYGHSFLDEYTSWEKDVKDSKSHQRIIKYKFGGLDFLVRFECDGYMKQDNQASEQQKCSDTLPEALANATLDCAIASSRGEILQVKEGGWPVSQEHVFEIKTRSIRSEFDVTDIIPKLWVTQIPKLIVGFHDRGLFEGRIQVHDMKEKVAKWEKENEQISRKLASLLQDLIDVAKVSTTRLEVCRSASGCLQIREPEGEGPRALPHDMKEMWEGKHRENQLAQEDEIFEEDAHSNLDEIYEEDFEDNTGWDSGEDSGESSNDYTACSAEDCGYCGRCRY
ncbi:hypothetical protein PRK78_001903 [Emydomyces testavorans]|uniref:Geranylgeranyl pyrophosphate synthetase n=1 Tax=Emydomyces testavorans TaxID=2070801 RepID=A0AAF0IJ48_9EURO|nr:hypothetical protein PRK78_001903 [Emydomyces testavorans]